MYNRGEIEIYFKHKIPYLGEKGWSRLTMLEERNIFQITAVLQFFFSSFTYFNIFLASVF